MQAYCGLKCEECGAYIAKKTDDDVLREKTANRWSAPEYQVVPSEINCDGCKSDGGVLFKDCETCEVRTCASSRELETCAHCDDYPCYKLLALWDILGEEAKNNLIQISQNL
jgi:hypothetical protein